MGNLIKYRLKCFLKNKVMIFWSLCFPLILSTIFFFVFSELTTAQPLETINIAVVEDGNNELSSLISQLSDKNSDDYIFNTTYTNKDDGRKSIEEGNVKALLILSEIPVIESYEKGYEYTILKSVINTYSRVYSQVENIAINNPEVLSDLVIQDLMNANINIHDLNSKAGGSDMNTTYFYTTIAMACLYGAFWGLIIVNDAQANQSAQAARINLAPTRKMKIVLVDYMIAYFMVFTSILMLFSYLKFILNIDFGSNIGLMIIISLAGSLFSLSIGMLIGTIKKFSFQTKVGIISGGTVLLNFFAGMMSPGIPYLINQYIPILRWINPADLITRSFSILYYYENYDVVYLNALILCGLGMVALLIAFLRVRKVSYASL